VQPPDKVEKLFMRDKFIFVPCLFLLVGYRITDVANSYLKNCAR